MKKYLCLIFACLITTLVVSCKLDKPILPGHPGYVAQYPPGSGADTTGTGNNNGSGGGGTGGGGTGGGGTGGGGTGGGGTGGGGTGGGGTSINNSILTGTWTVKSTLVGGYIDGKFNSGAPSVVNFFTDVELDDAKKTGVIDPSGIVPDSVTYTLTKTGNNTYITFSNDPYPRSANNKIQITNLGLHGMTWIAIDPQVISAGGHTSQIAITCTLTK